jgi:hypothetical protein
MITKRADLADLRLQPVAPHTAAIEAASAFRDDALSTDLAHRLKQRRAICMASTVTRRGQPAAPTTSRSSAFLSSIAQERRSCPVEVEEVESEIGKALAPALAQRLGQPVDMGTPRSSGTAISPSSTTARAGLR